LELFELFFTRREHHDTRVEYIGPSYVRYCGELVVKVEKVQQGAEGENVCIQEYYLGVLREAEDMYLC